MWVVKLGGSLDTAGRLGDWARALTATPTQSRQPLLVVPGGGPFADAVRAAQQRWAFDERTAHVMAVLAMEQMAHLIRSLSPGLEATENVNEPPAPAGECAARIWHPRRELLGGGWPDAGDIPADWDVTSDSLAAFVAGQARADGLVLVKSSPLQPPAASVESLQSAGVLDAAFKGFGARCGCPVWLIPSLQPRVLFDLLHGDDRAAVRVCFDPRVMLPPGRR